MGSLETKKARSDLKEFLSPMFTGPEALGTSRDIRDHLRIVALGYLVGALFFTLMLSWFAATGSLQLIMWTVVVINFVAYLLLRTGTRQIRRALAAYAVLLGLDALLFIFMLAVTLILLQQSGLARNGLMFQGFVAFCFLTLCVVAAFDLRSLSGPEARERLTPYFDLQRAEWDPLYFRGSTEWKSRSGWRGCLTRLLWVIGPAIGLSLDEVLGRDGANNVLVLLSLLVTLMPLRATFKDLALCLFLIRLEREIGRPILLRG